MSAPITDAAGSTDADAGEISPERADLLAMLGKHRYFLTHPLRDLTDEQAALTPTASQLCLGGLIKHVTATEASWADFVVNGPGPAPDFENFDYSDFENGFRMLPGETLDGLLAAYRDVAARTDELVASVPDLDASHPLPEAPWFEAGARWTIRRTFMHIIAETAQHAGHADIIRESIDGAKSMG